MQYVRYRHWRKHAQTLNLITKKEHFYMAKLRDVHHQLPVLVVNPQYFKQPLLCPTPLISKSVIDALSCFTFIFMQIDIGLLHLRVMGRPFFDILMRIHREFKILFLFIYISRFN